MSLLDNKLNDIRHRYDEIISTLADPAVFSDPSRYQKLNKELTELEPIVGAINEVERLESELEQTQEMFDMAGDEEMRTMAREEIRLLDASIESELEKLRELTSPKDPNDQKSVIIEIRAGAGGDEAALFCSVLFGMYSAYAQGRGWTVEQIDSSPTGLGGYKEIIFSIEGAGAYSRFKYERGVHRVQRVPVTESSGRIHTSTVTVAVLPEAEAVEVDIQPGDLRIDTFRASGAGGQHVNTTDSAIRITHIPTGLVVQCQDQRSQYKNKDKAMALLMSRLQDLKNSEIHGQVAMNRKAQVGTGDRSERIRTYNYHQGRVSDHRINMTIYKLDSFLAGDIDEIIDALASADKADQLMGVAGEDD